MEVYRACKAPKLSPHILNEYDRKPNQLAWTEGLQWHQGYLYESTGSPTGVSGKGSNAPGLSIQSFLNQLKLAANAVTVEKSFSLPFKYFAEGLARDNNRLYQLTKDSATVLVYELEPLQQLRNLPTSTQGVARRWGLCFDQDKQMFYLSDGTATLKLYTKRQFEAFDLAEPAAKLRVSCNGKAIAFLNDLEFARGYIYAAVMEDENSNCIVKIDSATGNVVAQINAQNLRSRQQNTNAKDLNGIAHYRTDPEDGQDVFFVTGKFWSKIFEVKFLNAFAL